MPKSGFPLAILLFFAAGALRAQRAFPEADFTEVDQLAVRTDAPTLESLAAQLTDEEPSELLKVRAIFRWMTEHIAFDVAEARRKEHYAELWPPEIAPPKEYEEEFERRVAQHVFEERKAICYGYAALFKMLCQQAGLEAVVVRGYARSQTAGIGQASGLNHAWNLVVIDGKEYLLDVTWASGFASAEKFTKSFQDQYFLTPPHEFLLNHYPKLPEQSLAGERPSREAFFSFPIVLKTSKFPGMQDISPANGRIECRLGDTVAVSFISRERIDRLGLVGLSAGNTLVQQNDPAVFAVSGQDRPGWYPYTAKMVVTNRQVQWIHLRAGNQNLLRYQLKVLP